MPRKNIPSPSVWALIALGVPLAPLTAATMVQNTGELRGVVLDAGTRQPLAGVEVSFVQIDFSAHTDSTGHYAITNIPPGRYTLLVKGEGFKPAVASRHMLLADSVNVLDFRLERIDEDASLPEEPNPAQEYWSQIIPGPALRPNTDLRVALRRSVTNVRLQQVAPITGVSRRAPPIRTDFEGGGGEFLWVVDGRAVRRARAVAVNTSEVTCVEIRRGAAAVQRFTRTIPGRDEGTNYEGVILVWTQGSRTPMPEACSQP